MPLPLRTTVFWGAYRLLDRAPVLQQPPERVRAISDRRSRAARIPGAALVVGRLHPGVEARDSSVSSTDGTRLPVRCYRPRDASTPLAVVLNFHGGGWVSGDSRQSEWWASSLAAAAGVAVVSVDYRLAPEHPFPGPPEDCYDAAVWVVEHAREFGIDAGRVAVMGDSAGGNLAAVVAMMARDRGGPTITLQVLLYPAVDLVASFASEVENAKAPVLGKKDLDSAPKLYFHGSDRDPADPYASPIRGKLNDLPAALIQTAQYDPLRDHGAAYAAALQNAGVPVRLTNYVDAVHGYASLPGLVPAARQALGEAAAVVRQHLS